LVQESTTKPNGTQSGLDVGTQSGEPGSSSICDPMEEFSQYPNSSGRAPISMVSENALATQSGTINGAEASVGQRLILPEVSRAVVL